VLISAAVAYDSAGNKATLKPSVSLAPGKTYTVSVRGGANGATDISGNPLPADYNWSFVTVRPSSPAGPSRGSPVL
jgi:hypothetical protein